MPDIRVLPKNIADLISAGEVVERPASVVKELMENSIDAGSTCITVEIMNGGIKFIRVTDNGSGINEKNIRNAFLSHATSKILTEDDLNSIYTLGFRGEALASICAVSKVDILTKTQDEEGVHYIIEGGSEKELSQAGCPKGTTIVVSDLFYNTPARMKFLKKDVSEGNAVADVVERIALSHPEISFRFIRDSKQVLITSGNRELLSVCYSVLGHQFTDNTMPIEYETDGVKVNGFISKPSFCRQTRSMQYFFLNGRHIKSKTIIAGLENSYKNSIMVGKFPMCVLNIFVSAESVDVNAHPTKTEVRFSDEKKIFNAVYYACLNSINEKDTRVKMDISKPVKRTIEKSNEHFVQMKMEQKKASDFWKTVSSKEFKSIINHSPDNSVNKNEEIFLFDDNLSQNTVIFNDVVKHEPIVFQNKEPSLLKEFDDRKKVRTNHNNPSYETKFDNEVNIKDEIDFDEDVRIIGEAFKTYIIAEKGSRLYLIDKHAAHERILYNKFKQNEITTQYLVAPVTVHLTKNEYTAVIENIELIKKTGYDIEDFGIGAVIVRECPSIISFDDIENQIIEIAGHFLEKSNDTNTEKIDWLFHNSACKGAIKAGDNTPLSEQQEFAQMLLNDESIRYCPHGRPILIEITKNDIEKQFGRLQ